MIATLLNVHSFRSTSNSLLNEVENQNGLARLGMEALHARISTLGAGIRTLGLRSVNLQSYRILTLRPTLYRPLACAESRCRSFSVSVCRKPQKPGRTNGWLVVILEAILHELHHEGRLTNTCWLQPCGGAGVPDSVSGEGAALTPGRVRCPSQSALTAWGPGLTDTASQRRPCKLVNCWQRHTTVWVEGSRALLLEGRRRHMNGFLFCLI